MDGEDPPKRPPSAYLLFMSDFRMEYKVREKQQPCVFDFFNVIPVFIDENKETH